MIYLLMTIGVFVAGSAVVFIKTGTIDSTTLAAYRLILSSNPVVPAFSQRCRKSGIALPIQKL